MAIQLSRNYIKLLLIIFLVIFAAIFTFFTQNTNDKSVLSASSAEIPQNLIATKEPVQPSNRLIIPVINVNANIQPVGINKNGEMEIPNNTTDVGWFKLGSKPGEKGSAVMAGHFDGKNGETGVFNNLHKLKKGDSVYVIDDEGISTTYTVQNTQTLDPGFAEDVFSRNDKVHLNLVTCDGVWDGVKKSYSKRLVVFTDIVD